MKTYVAALIATLPIALVLTACGSPPDSGKQGLSTSTTIEDVVVEPRTPSANMPQTVPAQPEKVSQRFTYTAPTKTGNVSSEEFQSEITAAVSGSTYASTPKNVKTKITQDNYGLVMANEAYIGDDGAMFVNISVPEDVKKEILKQADVQKGADIFPYLFCPSPGSALLAAENQTLACSAKNSEKDKKWFTIITVPSPTIQGVDIGAYVYGEPTFTEILLKLESLYGVGSYNITVDGKKTTFTGKGDGWSYVNTLSPKKVSAQLSFPDGSRITVLSTPAKPIQVSAENFPY